MNKIVARIPLAPLPFPCPCKIMAILPPEGFPGGSDDRESVFNAGDPSSVTGLEYSLEKGMATYSSTLAWKSLGQRSLVGYSPWGCKESDTMEQLTLALLPAETAQDGHGSVGYNLRYIDVRGKA